MFNSFLRNTLLIRNLLNWNENTAKGGSAIRVEEEILHYE